MYTDYYSVYDENGKKICDASNIDDAIMMVSLKSGRTYKKINIMLDQIVNVPFQRMEDDKQLKEQRVLPDRQQEPLNLQ